jgi:NAD(P)-dependent dehydrogenase (short-subunit alcohol dehydrogenase family)
MKPGRVLLFGGTGTLGKGIRAVLESQSWSVSVISRGGEGNQALSMTSPDWMEKLGSEGLFDAVIWAQGINLSGNILEVETSDVRLAFEANVVFILETLQLISSAGLLNKPCRGVIVSSIWQELARPEKTAYIVSKAALSGLIPSMAIDLAHLGFAVNGVLPGVIDTPMTRSQLSPEQINRIESASLGGKLATIEQVANAVYWLASPLSSGVNGEWVRIDNGWSINRVV